MQEIKITKQLHTSKIGPHMAALFCPVCWSALKKPSWVFLYLIGIDYRKVVHFVTRSQCYEIFVSITEYFGKRVFKLFKGLYVYPKVQKTRLRRMRRAPSKCFEIFASKFLSILEIFFSVSFSLLFNKFEGVLWLSLPLGRSVTQLIPHRIRKPDFT